MMSAFEKKVTLENLVCVLAATVLHAFCFMPASAEELRASISPPGLGETTTVDRNWSLRVSEPISVVPGSLAESLRSSFT